MAEDYHDPWCIIACAEHKMRKLHLERIRRRLASEHSELQRVGLQLSFQPAAPWDLAFREAARYEHFCPPRSIRRYSNTPPLRGCGISSWTRGSARLGTPTRRASDHETVVHQTVLRQSEPEGRPRRSGTRRRGRPRTAKGARTLEEEEGERQGQRRRGIQRKEVLSRRESGPVFLGVEQIERRMRTTLSAQQV